MIISTIILLILYRLYDILICMDEKGFLSARDLLQS